MKQKNFYKTLLTLAFLFLFIISSFKTSFAWDTTAAKLYPLSVGNYYVFEEKHLFLNCAGVEYINYYTAKIVSDTIFSNGKRYFKFISNWYLWQTGWTYQRIDSNTMNVYGTYNSSTPEKLFDSLLARKNDTFLGKRNVFAAGPCIVTDTSTQYLLDATRLKKDLVSGGSISLYYSLLEGIGFYRHYNCELGEGAMSVLKGCIINGVLYGDTTVSSIRQISSEVPVKYKLHQNYPNPFNPTTNIKFDLPKTSDVKLIIFDAIGRVVATLVNEKLSAGSYEVEWIGSNYPSGVYIYILHASNFVDVKKMILLK